MTMKRKQDVHPSAVDESGTKAKAKTSAGEKLARSKKSNTKKKMKVEASAPVASLEDDPDEAHGLELVADQQSPKGDDSSLSEVKKKKKRGKKLNHVHESVSQGKALRYLEAWDKDLASWKFQKCRQIWLLQNAYDAVKIPDAKFDMLLKYVGSVKGKMRDLCFEKAQQLVHVETEWHRLSEEGRLDSEIQTSVGHPRPTAKVLDRAKEIIEMLS